MKIKPLLTIEDLANVLGRPGSSIRTSLSRDPDGLHPCIKLKRHIRWKPAFVRAWLTSKETVIP